MNNNSNRNFENEIGRVWRQSGGGAEGGACGNKILTCTHAIRFFLSMYDEYASASDLRTFEMMYLDPALCGEILELKAEAIGYDVRQLFRKRARLMHLFEELYNGNERIDRTKNVLYSFLKMR